MNKGYNQNNMNFQNMPNIRSNNEEYMYPEIYHKCAPIVDKMIKDMERQYGCEIELNEDLLNEMVEEAIRRSGMGMNNMPPAAVPYNGKDGEDGEAIPTIHEFGGRHGGFDGRDRDRGFVSDIFRILFLQQLFGRRRHNWRWR